MADKSCGQSAAASVLGQFELLDAIFENACPSYTFDGYNPYSITISDGWLRVNKLWFSVLVKYVWRHLDGRGRPSRLDLELLADNPHRLQTYAKYVETLHIDKNSRNPRRTIKEQEDRSRLHQLLSVVEFPRLRKLAIGSYSLDDCIPFANPVTHFYLRDSLTQVTLRSLAAPPHFWTLLKDRCPNIEVLVKRGRDGDCFDLGINENTPPDPAELEPFQKFLESSNMLREVWLTAKWFPFDMLRSLRCLAQKPLLSTLEFGKGPDFTGESPDFIRTEWIRLMLNVKPDAFRGLKKFRLCTTNTA